MNCHLPESCRGPMLRLVSGAFIAGGLFAISLHVFIQDFLGKEEYIKRVGENWFELSPIIGLLGAVFSLFILLAITLTITKKP